MLLYRNEIARLYQHTGDHVCLADGDFPEGEPETSGFGSIWDDIAKRIHAGEAVVIDEGLVKAIGEQLWAGAVLGYGANFPDVDFNSPDWLMLQSLEANTYYFSAAKTIQQLALANSLLIDPATNEPRPFNVFRYLIEQQVNEVYNVQYLKAEYNMAIAASQSARAWQDDLLLLETHVGIYRTQQDGRVRPKHARLEGIALPLSDPFWGIANPPNAYGCRCYREMIPREEAAISDSESAGKAADLALTELDKNGNNRLEMFRYNPGSSRMVYPPGHPYYNLPGGGEDVARNAADQATPDRGADA